MEGICGPDIRVILSIKQGRGFSHFKLAAGDGIFIEATLNGTILDTDVVPITEEPIFDAELMWESDKKTLRRLHSERTTLKVQCFSVNHMHMKQGCIGNFIMILRQAHIVPSGKSYTEIGESWSEWQKLNGAKPPYPELLCSLRVEEKPKMPRKLLPGNYNIEDDAENEQLWFHYSIMDYAINTAKIAMSNIYKPIPLNEKMVIALYSSLENLQQYFSSSSKLIVKLMTGENEIGFTEMFMQGLVPTTNKPAFCSLDKDNTVMIESPCFLKGFRTGEVPTSPSGLQPYINLRIMLKYQEREQKAIGQGEGQFEDNPRNAPARLLRSYSYTILDSPTQPVYKVPIIDMEDSGDNNNAQIIHRMIHHRSTVDAHGTVNQDTNKNVHFSGHRQASGDITEEGENVAQLLKEIKTTSGQRQLSESSGQFRLPCSQIISKDYHAERILHDSSTQAPEVADEGYHIYTLDITVQSVAFHQLPPQRTCYIKFHHPKAEIISKSHPEITIKEPNKDIQLQDIKCNLTFVSTPGEIHNLLLAWPPKISVCDTVEGQSNQLAVAMLNVGSILEEEMKECYCNTPLLDLRTEQEVGTLAIKLTLDDHGPKRIEEQDLGPAILDDRIAFRIVEELEEWKERQQELFKAELQRKEQAHLSALSEGWKKRQMEIEKNLNCSMKQCQKLAQSLNDTADELRLKTCKNTEAEQELNQYKEIIELKYKLKVLEMKEATRRIEDDHSLKTVKLEREKEDLEQKMLRMEKENALLKEMVTAQEHDLNKMKETLHTKDQTVSLLQELKSIEEKLESALKSKTYFKEQWARTVREINCIRNEHQQNIHIQSKRDKEELRNVGKNQIPV